MAEPIEVPFGLWTRVAQGSTCMVCVGPDPPREGAILGERIPSLQTKNKTLKFFKITLFHFRRGSMLK